MLIAQNWNQSESKTKVCFREEKDAVRTNSLHSERPNGRCDCILWGNNSWEKKICSYYNWPSLDAESSGCICFLLFAIVRSGWLRCIMISFQKRCGKWSLKKWSGSGNLSSLVPFVSDDDDDGDDDDIYIMMQCLFVTKNEHFLLGVSCNHLNPP